MAENDVSDGSDFDNVFDDENDIVLDSDGPGEAEDPIGRMMGHDMLVNAMFNNDDDDLSDFEGFDAAWIENTANFCPVREPAFRLIVGSQIQHPPKVRAIDYFDFFFHDAMWEKMVEETNRYAEQQRAANPTPSLASQWDPVTVPVVKAFIGLPSSCSCPKDTTTGGR